MDRIKSPLVKAIEKLEEEKKKFQFGSVEHLNYHNAIGIVCEFLMDEQLALEHAFEQGKIMGLENGDLSKEEFFELFYDQE